MDLAVALAFKRDFLGRLARWTGLARWTHAALFYSWDGELRVIESGMWGVVERDWSSFFDEWDSVILLRPTIPLTTAAQREIVAYAWGNVGKPYSLAWLLLVAWRLIKERWITGAFTCRAHICSSLVYSAFLYGGLNLLPGQQDILVTPDDLASSPWLKAAR